jgi:hypothetical protein
VAKIGTCCCIECLIFSDDFTRAETGTPLGNRVSSPFIGQGWCDKPGDYYLVNVPTWRARCEVPNAKAICNVKHPDNVGSMYVSLMTQEEQPRTASQYGAGQKWRLYLNVDRTVSGTPQVCTAVSYYFAEYERLGGSTNPADFSWIRLGIGGNGTETILKQMQVPIETELSRLFWAIIDDDSFCAGIGASALYVVSMKSPGLFPNGFYSGFGMSEKNMLADDFSFYRHYNSNPPKTRELDCPRCGFCMCEDNTGYGTSDDIELPPVLNVCIWPDPQNCARLEKLEPCCFSIEYDAIDQTWKHAGNVCCGGFVVRFVCAGNEPGAGKYALINQGGCTQSGEGLSIRNPMEYKCSSETGESCFRFGPYFIADSDFACQCRNTYFGTGSCSYYVTVSSNSCCSRSACNDL